LTKIRTFRINRKNHRVCYGTHSVFQDVHPAQAINYSETYDLQLSLLINLGAQTVLQITITRAPLFNTVLNYAGSDICLRIAFVPETEIWLKTS